VFGLFDSQIYRNYFILFLQPNLPDVHSINRRSPQKNGITRVPFFSTSTLSLGVDVTHVDDISSDDEGFEASEVSAENIPKNDCREMFKNNMGKGPAADALEFDMHIATMRVKHEDELKRFHYREKTQHRKVQKWINKKLWHIDRLETKGDYQPKIQSFSSILHEIPMNVALKKNHSNVLTPVDLSTHIIDWHRQEEDEYGEVSESEEDEYGEVSEPEEEEIEEVSEDDCNVDSNKGLIDITISVVHDLYDLSEYSLTSSELLASSGLLKTGTDAINYVERDTSSEGVFSMLDDDDDPNPDYILQNFTSFAYHGEDDDGIQL
jgi:hypothetical protein